MTRSAFRISGEVSGEFSATEPVRVEASALSVRLIDGRLLSIKCDPHGLTRAMMFTTATGAILRAEERVYCISPGVGETSFPGVENRFTPEQKMDVFRELNVNAVPSHIGLRRIVTAALSKMDAPERERALVDNFSKKELAGAVIESLDWDDLSAFAASIYSAPTEAQEVIAAE